MPSRIFQRYLLLCRNSRVIKLLECVGLNSEFVKYSGDMGIWMLNNIIVEVWQSGKAPFDWKRAVLVPLLKRVT
jgi:hypothetical protein